MAERCTDKKIQTDAHAVNRTSMRALFSWLHKAIRRGDGEKAIGALYESGFASKVLVYLVLTLLPEDIGIEAASYIVTIHHWFTVGISADDKDTVRQALEVLLSITKTVKRSRIVASLTSTSVGAWEDIMDAMYVKLRTAQNSVYSTAAQTELQAMDIATDSHEDRQMNKQVELAGLQMVFKNRFTFKGTPDSLLTMAWDARIRILREAILACRAVSYDLLKYKCGLKLLQKAANVLQGVHMCFSLSGRRGNGSPGRTEGMKKVWEVLGCKESESMEVLRVWHERQEYKRTLVLFYGLVLACTGLHKTKQVHVDAPSFSIEATGADVPEYAMGHDEKAGYDKFFCGGEAAGIYVPKAFRGEYEAANRYFIQKDYMHRKRFERANKPRKGKTANRMAAMFPPTQNKRKHKSPDASERPKKRAKTGPGKKHVLVYSAADVLKGPYDLSRPGDRKTYTLNILMPKLFHKLAAIRDVPCHVLYSWPKVHNGQSYLLWENVGATTKLEALKHTTVSNIQDVSVYPDSFWIGVVNHLYARYILGVGDSGPHNILVHARTGHPVGIDLGKRRVFTEDLGATVKELLLSKECEQWSVLERYTDKIIQANAAWLACQKWSTPHMVRRAEHYAQCTNSTQHMLF